MTKVYGSASAALEERTPKGTIIVHIYSETEKPLVIIEGDVKGRDVSKAVQFIMKGYGEWKREKQKEARPNG